MVRTVEELLDVPDPAWPGLLAACEAAGAMVLPISEHDGREALYRIQVTARSALGAMALHTGGLLVGGGWLRVLGGGTDRLRGLVEANGFGDPTEQPGPPPHLRCAEDVLGGRFAVNGGGLPGDPGEVCYLAPDTLGWEPTGLGHGDFVRWCLDGDLAGFYADLRWPGWEAEVAGLAPDEGLSCYPPPFSVEGQDLARTSRAVVPVAELHAFYAEAAAQLGA